MWPKLCFIIIYRTKNFKTFAKFMLQRKKTELLNIRGETERNFKSKTGCPNPNMNIFLIKLKMQRFVLFYSYIIPIKIRKA